MLFLLFLWLTTILKSQAQQPYIDNQQLECDTNYTATLGYTCNSIKTCQSFLTFRSQPPLYNTPSSIAALLRSNAKEIATLNNFSSNSATIPANNIVIVPISNCSCSNGGFYQYNVSYVLTRTSETYFTIANDTFEGLSTCQALKAQNTINLFELHVGNNITVPLRCACPTANQTAAGIRYLLTYLIAWNDDIDTISENFEGVGLQRILDANEILESHVIFPFTSILIPLKTEPRRFNASAAPATPPTLPVIPIGPGSGGGGGSSNKQVFIGVGVGVGLLIIVLVFLVTFWFCRRRKIQNHQHNLPSVKNSTTAVMNPPKSNWWSVSSEGLRIAIESLTVYKYRELQKATGGFSEENRMNGSVYKGIFNGDFAAVKIMKGDVSGEINILKQINHSNIIRLSGFCLHQGNTYLVYEFADNGSLSDWLHSVAKNMKYDLGLEWKQRVQIAHDVADALNYLHNFITPPYVHKNLNSSNVLLDGNMRAKVTNFGLARSVDENDNDKLQLTRHVVGTYGYMPPEYIEHGLITPKMDVFALGVLISELLSGKEAATQPPESGGDTEKGNDEEMMVLQKGRLSDMIKQVVGGDNGREKLSGFMDERLNGEYPVELAYSMAEIACKCVAADLNDRPSVAEVFMTLSKIMSSS